MKNKVIAFITSHTHTSKERRKNTFKTQQKKNTLTLVANVCVKQEAKQQQKKRQPELHQLTTKQTKEKILSNRKEIKLLKKEKSNNV